MTRMKESKGLCPVCVEEKSLTDDHIPPKAIFLPPRPLNTITVKTCINCNKGSEKDDEYFRIYIASSGEADGPQMELWKKKVRDSTFKRSWKLKVSIQEVIQNVRRFHQVKTYNGRILSTNEMENILAFDSERIDRVIKKIIRCLHFHHYASVIPLEAKMNISTEPLSFEEIEDLIVTRTGLVGSENGEFIYRCRCGQAKGIWNWVLLFYLDHCFRVSVTNVNT